MMVILSLPVVASADSLMIGDVRVTVTTIFGSVNVQILMADSSGTVLMSYFSSAIFYVMPNNLLLVWDVIQKEYLQYQNVFDDF